MDLTNLGRELDEVVIATSATAPSVNASNGAVSEARAEFPGKMRLQSFHCVYESLQFTCKLTNRGCCNGRNSGRRYCD